ncbi:MAG: DNA-processing protein DprA [Vampirovibrionales bacterium]
MINMNSLPDRVSPVATVSGTASFSDNASESPSSLSGTAGTVAPGLDSADPFDQLAAQFTALRQPAKHIAIIGSRNIPLAHQQLIEAIAYTLVRDGNTIVTSGGASGANAAAIRGAMRANPQKLLVILPQTLGQQPSDVQDELIGVANIQEHPEWNMMPLADASRLCNRAIVDACDQLIIFLFHNSSTQQTAVEYAEGKGKIITPFYLD